MPGKSSFAIIGTLALLLVLTLAACTAPATSSLDEAPVQPTMQMSTSDAVAQAATVMPTPDPASAANRPIEISAVVVEIGVGSPIPVEAVASGTWPDLCAQLAEVRQQFDGARFEINVMASPAQADCPPDPVGIPFRLAIPLNMVNLAPGSYTVAVNGVETTFEWIYGAAEPLPVENLGLTFAYIGWDGNLWIADAAGGPPRQLSSDAAAMEAGGEVISYDFPSISSDGRFIAVRRDAGVPHTEGVSYTFGLWVYDTESGEARLVYEDPDQPPAGFDWKPGTHLLAYGVGSDPNYFTVRGGKPNPDLTTGIFAVDLDTGETSLLVNPENGYSLILPEWSPDGRFLSFDELVYMEGRGPFAYYDFEEGRGARQYIAWNEALGEYDWSPDGEQLLYDRLSYAPNGTERIFTRPRLEGAEQQLSPEPEQGYAFLPVYAPDGQQIAYLVNPGSPENVQHSLVVQDLATGEVRELGSYESAWYLEWSADGRALLFSAGPYDAQQIYAYDLARGEVAVLAEGGQPTLAGR